MNTMTKWELFSLLSQRGTPWLTVPDNHYSVADRGLSAILQSVQRESGDGRNFMLHVIVNGQGTRPLSWYITTID